MSYLILYAFVLHSQTGTRRGRSRVTRSLSYAPEVVYMSARTPCGPAELEAAHNPVLVELRDLAEDFGMSQKPAGGAQRHPDPWRS